MIEIVPVAQATVGAFFVVKSNGKLRLILDTRLANTFFRSPDPTVLPSAGSLASLEISEGEDICGAQGGIANAFYQVELPFGLRSYFVLPPVTSQHLSNSIPQLSSASQWSPRLKVLPMGWSLSVLVMLGTPDICSAKYASAR